MMAAEKKIIIIEQLLSILLNPFPHAHRPLKILSFEWHWFKKRKINTAFCSSQLQNRECTPSDRRVWLYVKQTSPAWTLIFTSWPWKSCANHFDLILLQGQLNFGTSPGHSKLGGLVLTCQMSPFCFCLQILHKIIFQFGNGSLYPLQGKSKTDYSKYFNLSPKILELDCISCEWNVIQILFAGLYLGW
jgi:hypothetical protein